MTSDYNQRVLKVINRELMDVYPPNPMKVVDALRKAGYHIVSTPKVEVEREEYDPRTDFNFGVGAMTFVHLGIEVDATRLSYSRHATCYSDFRALDWMTVDMAQRFGFELLQKLIDDEA